MLLYITIIHNPALFSRIIQWVKDIKGTELVRCVDNVEAAQALYAENDGVRSIITDLPPGTALHERYDRIFSFTNGEAQIVFLNLGAERIEVPAGDRSFTIVSETNLEERLNKALIGY